MTKGTESEKDGVSFEMKGCRYVESEGTEGTESTASTANVERFVERFDEDRKTITPPPAWTEARPPKRAKRVSPGTEGAAGEVAAENDSEDKKRPGLFRRLSNKLRSRKEGSKVIVNVSPAEFANDQQHDAYIELKPLQPSDTYNRSKSPATPLQTPQREALELHLLSVSLPQHADQPPTNRPGPPETEGGSGGESADSYVCGSATPKSCRSLGGRTWESETPPSLTSGLSSNSTNGGHLTSSGAGGVVQAMATVVVTTTDEHGPHHLKPSPPWPALQRQAIFTEMSSHCATSSDHEEILSLPEGQSRRRCRQLLLEIEDDHFFAEMAGRLMEVDGETMDPRPEETVGPPELLNDAVVWEPTSKTGDWMKAFFVVRELVQGERRFVNTVKFGMQVSLVMHARKRN